MNSKRPSVIKSTARAGAGGAVVVAAILALMFMRGGGGAPGPDSDTGSPPLATTETNPTTTEPPPAETNSPSTMPGELDSTGGLTPDEENSLSDNVLTILVDERSYLMELPSDEGSVYRPAELPRLLELAQMVQGDTNGIRVRILHRESARVSAENDLKTALADLGIGTDAIYIQAEFIP